MPFYTQLQGEINKKIKALQELIPQETNNILVHKLYELAYTLRSTNTHKVHLSQIAALLKGASHLINNLVLAKNATNYVNENTKNQGSNTSQQEIKKSAFKKFYGRLQIINEIKYFNIFKRHVASDTKKKSDLNKKLIELGCKEQCEIALSYLHQQHENAIIEERTLLITKLQRISISNDAGGHIFLLLNHDTNAVFPKDATNLAKGNSNLGETCVVIDPANRTHQFYPASDLDKHLLSCAQYGEITIDMVLPTDQPQFNNDNSESNVSSLKPK